MTILEAEAVKVNFGTVHAGKTLGAIAAADITYIDFLLGCDTRSDYFAEALALVAEKHGRRAKTLAAKRDTRQGELF
jgi:hypothetical protein